jgi:hypothetical protein
MLHLPTDRLAELGDEVPTPDEAAHLAACPACAQERAAYQSLVAMALAEREPFGLPLTRWDAIAAELSSGAKPALTEALPIRPARSNRWILQIAAGLLLVAGGAMGGRMSAGRDPLPSAPQTTASGSATVTTSSPVATNVSAPEGTRADPDSAFFASVDDARNALQRSELTYQQASSYLARFDTTGASSSSPVAYRSRLAALDRVISTTREAMRQAPHDPVINGYYLTTLGQREATLRQLNTVLPASLRVNSF